MQKFMVTFSHIIWCTVLILFLSSVGLAQETKNPETVLLGEGKVNETPIAIPIIDKTYSLIELQEDFAQLKKAVLTSNSLLFTDKQELEKTFDTQYAKLREGMGELEFYRVLTPSISMIKCGHTLLQPSKEFDHYLATHGRFLPLKIKVINDQAFIYRNFSPTLIPAGSEIVSINGKPIKEIISMFLNNLSADGVNLTYKRHLINLNFALYYYRFIDNPAEFAINYLNPQDHRTFQILIPALTKAEQVQNLTPNPTFPETKATLQSNTQYTKEIESNYAVLTIKSFAFYENHMVGHFRAFIDSFFKEVATKKINNLILDLRENGGGNPFCTAHLFSYLISAPTPYFSSDTKPVELTMPILPAKNSFYGNIYILVNGGSFAATSQLISLLKFNHIGTIIGEETGGTYIYADNPVNIVLNHTKLRLGNPRTEFKTSVTGFVPGRGILPDVEVHATISDYINGRDVEKEVALGQILSGL